tara:strand:- start:2919 stop:3104 length:186 start_codon:yes stop_codon:yes gene_type:complete
LNIKNYNMKVELTQKEIDRLYFDLKDYVKTLYNVDRLNELTESNKEECKIELELINKFSKL